MTVGELIAWFETWANPDWQEKWDNCGWQVEPGILTETARVLVCLTPTLAVMKEAIALQEQGTSVNLIFSHHPLIFGSLKSVRNGDPLGDIIQQAITHRIGIYSAHTNFDQVANGTADVLAQLLNLKDTQPIELTQNGLGYGRVGNLNPPLTLQRLLERIQTQLNPPELLVSPVADRQQTITRVAVLGGSGASYIAAACQTGAQVYLTSDCKFHQFQDSRDHNLILIDAGHYATERPACAKLAQTFQQFGVEWVELSQQDEDFRSFFKAGLGYLVDP